MNKYNTKQGQLLSFVERPRFEKVADDTEADKYSKGFLSRQQFVIMVYIRLANQNGLRTLAHSLNALGIKPNVFCKCGKSGKSVHSAPASKPCSFSSAMIFSHESESLF